MDILQLVALADDLHCAVPHVDRVLEVDAHVVDHAQQHQRTRAELERGHHRHVVDHGVPALEPVFVQRVHVHALRVGHGPDCRAPFAHEVDLVVVVQEDVLEVASFLVAQHVWVRLDRLYFADHVEDSVVVEEFE